MLDQESRFWAKVDKHTGPVHPVHGKCWIWTASLNHCGYGGFSFNGKMGLAHRAAWYFANGHYPELHVLHRCDNPPCVNPAHLFLGTQLENIADRVSKGRDGAAWGERNRHAKLTADDVIDIRMLAALGATQSTIKNEYGISQPQVSSIIRRTTWRHVQ